PWMSRSGYCESPDSNDGYDLVAAVAPIQPAIRLLLPRGSRLLDRPEMQPHVGPFDPATLTHRWTHPDPRVDALQADVAALVGTRLNADRRPVFDEVSGLAHARACLTHARPDARPPPHR